MDSSLSYASFENVEKSMDYEKPYQYATSSTIFNTFQTYQSALVIDFRAPVSYIQSHLFYSINFPHTRIAEKDLIALSPNELAEKYLEGKPLTMFKKRKRLAIFLIPSIYSVEHFLGKPKKIAEAISGATGTKSIAYQDAKGLLDSYLIFKALRGEGIKEIFIFPKGAKAFCEINPFLCEYSNAKIYIEPKRKSYPNEILPGKLFLGDQFDAQDQYVMKNLKITHIINATSEIPNYFEKEGKRMYLRIDIEDKKESRIHFYFPRVFGFIDGAIFGGDKSVETKLGKEYKFYEQHKEERKAPLKEEPENVVMASFLHAVTTLRLTALDKFEQKSVPEIEKKYEAMIKGKANSNRVLVHCAMGISRSASIVIMYIMKKLKVSFESALAFVQSKRPQVDPNDGFRTQLLQFEKGNYSLIKTLSRTADFLPK